MARKKRHAAAEIAAKLREADALAAKGQTQADIAKVLGISVMTFHRWRKMRGDRTFGSGIEKPVFPERTIARSPASEANTLSRIAELQTENDRLRKLLTDLLLERTILEDDRKPLRDDGKIKSSNKRRAL
jgi:putative transposase